MKMGTGQVYIKLATVLLLFSITGCATRPGIKNNEDIVIWVDKAAQAGCNNLSQVMNVSVSHDAIANAMLRIARKTGLGKESVAENQLASFFTNPESESILVLSKINHHALDTVESFIKRWKGEAPSSSLICVFAQEDRAGNLRQLAREKGFNLHITPLSVIYPEIESDKK